MTTQDSYRAAVRTLTKQGIKFRSNVRECCRGCIGSEKLGMKDENQPYGYTYGSQGSAFYWNENGEAVQKEEWGSRYEKAEEIYINHGNGSAAYIVEAFREQGIEAEWDGTEYSCVVLNFAD